MPENPNCSTCRWWETESSSCPGAFGECRRHSPLRSEDREGVRAYPYPVWPPTSSQDWCGEHAPRAEAPVVGADFGAGDDRTVICVPTLAHYVSAAADHGATVEGPVSPGDSFTVGSVTWVFRPVESPDAPR